MANINDNDYVPKEEYPPQVEQISWNPATLPFPSQLIVNPTAAPMPSSGGGAASHPGIDAAAFANFDDFNFSTNADVPVDWEHLDRKSAGCSVIDMNSKLDDSGRTFHGYKEGKYFLPNDAAEQDRLDLQHATIMLLMDGKLGFAPVANPKFVLDVATGTGIWALEYAEQHPETQVIGSDLSEIQPKWRMPNCSFVQDDCEEEWLFGTTDNPIIFDYIYLRWVFSCFDDPKKVMRNAYKNLQPGGWIEYCDTTLDFQSVDDNLEGTALKRWETLFRQGMALNGRDLRQPQYYAQNLREVGFVDVHEERRICPGNPWPQEKRLKMCGKYMMTNVCEGFRGASWKVFKHLGFSADEIEELIANTKKDACSQKYRWWLPVIVVYARKPFASEGDPLPVFQQEDLKTEDSG